MHPKLSKKAAFCDFYHQHCWKPNALTDVKGINKKKTYLFQDGFGHLVSLIKCKLEAVMKVHWHPKGVRWYMTDKHTSDAKPKVLGITAQIILLYFSNPQHDYISELFDHKGKRKRGREKKRWKEGKRKTNLRYLF